MTYAMGPDMKPERKQRGRERLADAMAERAASMEPVDHWLQGAQRLGEGYMTGQMRQKLDDPWKAKVRPEGRFGGMVRRGISGLFGG